MKEIIEVQMGAKTVDLGKCQTDLLAVGIFSDAKMLDRLNVELDQKLDGAIENIIKLGDFKGKAGSCAVIYGNSKIAAKRILLVGLGEKKKTSLDNIRRAAACAANRAVGMKAETISLAIHRAFGGKFGLEAVGQACAEGVFYGSYRYDEFVTDDKKRSIRKTQGGIN